jgi:hypothetical protein
MRFKSDVLEPRATQIFASHTALKFIFVNAFEYRSTGGRHEKNQARRRVQRTAGRLFALLAISGT